MAFVTVSQEPFVSQIVLAYLVTAGIFLALDIAWLATMSGRFYRPQLGALMRDQIWLPPSVAFYAIYAGVLTALVVAPAFAANEPSRAFVNGLLLGLAAYATYNLTNAATLNGWPTPVTLVDLAWGTLVTGLSAWLAVLALTAIRGAGG